MTQMPIDRDGEAQKALTLLKRMRKSLEGFEPGWQKWVAESLVEGLKPREGDGDASE